MRAHRRRSIVGIGALAFGLSAASAQSASLPPVRKIGDVVAQTKIELGDIESVRALSDGRILVSSNGARRVLLFDASLTTARTIDTLRSTQYSSPKGALVAARGDTSFVVNSSVSVDVIDPAGNIARTLPPPPAGRFGADILGDRTAGDRQGRILAIPPPPFFLAQADGFIGDTIVSGPEFVPILRFDPATRRVDTVATIRGPRYRQAITKFENGGRGTAAIDPFPAIGDEWAALSDGTVGIARLHGYSIDWVAPSGAKTAGPRVAHAWAAIDSKMKASMMASLRQARNAAHADSIFPSDSARYDSLSLVAKANPEALTDANGRRISLGPRPVRMQFVAPADLPDSVPPFAPSGIIVDADDNLWIPTWVPARPGGGMTFDVVNKTGVLVDRVELPVGASLVAFMPGYAFLRANGANGLAILKVRIR
jgi:hypothetical protein